MDSLLNYPNTTAIRTLSLVIISCLFLFRPSKVGNVREPPMVAGAWPILGHPPQLSRSKAPHKTSGAMADKYGPIFTIKLDAKQALVISNWEIAKECFTTNDMAVSSRPNLVATENLSYDGAMFGSAPYGPYWRELRKQRATSLQLNVRVAEVQASIKELFSLWPSRKNEFGYVLVDMKQWFAQLTLNTVLRMISGKRYFGAMDVADDAKAKRILKTMREFMRLFGVFCVGDAVPSPRWSDHYFSRSHNPPHSCPR